MMTPQIPLERFIGNFLLEVPAPSPGRVEVSESAFLHVYTNACVAVEILEGRCVVGVVDQKGVTPVVGYG